jgi:hypothetical protein
LRGVVGMARSQSPNSADSQFFICLGDAQFLNGDYTVWGRVTEGMAAVDGIKKAPPGRQSGEVDDPDKIISLNSDGSVRKIRINNRSIAPLKLPFNLVPPFYKALSEFRSILESEAAQYRFSLQPGDLMLFDNERVLHGRAGESIGARHLQGRYADRDGLLSTLRVLEKRDAG